MASMAKPVEPSPQLKSNILDAIASGKFPQVAPGESATEHTSDHVDKRAEVETAPATDHTQSNVVPLHREPASGGMSGFGRGLFAAAAAVVLLAGVGIAGTAHGWWGGDSVTQNGPNTGHSDSEHAAALGGDPMQGAEAEDHMHSIMAMDDVRSVSLTADGSTLHVVVSSASSAMDSGGAMVNGAPVLKDGMGAQVWSIDMAGTPSAGVIGQHPHENVWMPLPADTMTVRVTEEPMAGSEQPSGTVLAEGAL